MEITKSNLHTAIAALRQCAKENKNKNYSTGSIRVSDLCDDVADFLEKIKNVDDFLEKVKNEQI